MIKNTFSPAPVLLFTYKRIDTLRQTIHALQQNHLAKESDLLIFSDAAKNDTDVPVIAGVRTFLHTIKGFKKVSIVEATQNKGLANSIIDGVTTAVKEYGKVIVLEDDLVTTPNFLLYMNQALEVYKDNPDVFSIAAYTIPVAANTGYEYDVYFFQRASSWGWASWKDRWLNIDWSVGDFDQFKKDRKAIKRFQLGGSDLFGMLENQMQGKMDSWAIRWCYHQFKQKTFTAYPVVSKIKNIGFGTSATHTNVYNRYSSPLDEGLKQNFNFPESVIPEPGFTKQFQDYYSIKTRIKGRLMTELTKFGLLKPKK